MKHIVFKNLDYSGSSSNLVGCTLELKIANKMIETLREIREKIDKSNDLEREFNSKKKKKNSKTKFEPYAPPKTLKLKPNLEVDVSNFIDNNTMKNVQAEEAKLSHFISMKPDDDISKLLLIDQQDYCLKVFSSLTKEQLKDKIVNWLTKYVDDEEFFDERTNLWRKKYVEAEFKGTEALANFLKERPRPERGLKTLKIENKDYDVNDFLGRVDPYFRHSPYEIPPSFSEIKELKIRKMRNQLDNLKFEVLTPDEYLNQKFKVLNERWEENFVVSQDKTTSVS